jgi:hypothetical protein
MIKSLQLNQDVRTLYHMPQEKQPDHADYPIDSYCFFLPEGENMKKTRFIVDIGRAKL